MKKKRIIVKIPKSLVQNSRDARGNNVGRQIELCVTVLVHVLRDRRAISNMHNYYYCMNIGRG